ncbi:MAG: SAM-dependent methyltransferase, partial [Acidimicrobiia bacterium]
RAGRDFVTSPEVGPLFGVCVARALDREWTRQGRPDPFVVVEGGAGNGRLAREVLRADPTCAPALHYVLVERSATLRAEQATRLDLEPGSDAFGPSTWVANEESPVPVAASGPIVSSLDELPAVAFTGVVLANELLDNLPFEVVERTARGWAEVRIGVTDAGRPGEVLVPAGDDLLRWVGDLDVPLGTRLPVALGAADWIVAAATRMRRGALILVDYTAEWPELVARAGGWLRTYSEHRRDGDPLAEPGTRDITIDVPIDIIRRAATGAGLVVESIVTQAEWLRGLGIDDLVAEGRARWEAAAAAPDLTAVAGRSRGVEAAALTDPGGLGAHHVVVLRVG